MTDWIGQQIGKYEIKELLGRGGMGEVYKAFQPALERAVAIKLIHTHLAGEPGAVDRFRREAKVVAALRHPGIVQVYDFDVEGDAFYMVMEFISGESLKERLATLHAREERLPLDEALRLFQLITQAVAYAHSQGVVHRDLKPANVLLTAAGEPVLVDFGLSKILSGEQLTAQGVIMGTPQYMSPEQGSGAAVDAYSDVYALGVMLYELTTGTLPFSGDSPVGIILKHLSELPAPPRSINPALPEAVEQIIQKALAKDPAERYPSAQELLKAIEARILPQVEKATILSPTDDGRCPYRGLRVFEAEHAEFFFGREALVEQLVGQVANLSQAAEVGQVANLSQAGGAKSSTRFLTVLGASGSGKSSLVRAGLVPALQAGAIPGSDEWAILVLKPGNRPLEELAAQLAPVLYSEGERLTATRQLLDNLNADGRALHLAVRLAWAETPPEQYLLLVIDQFEEIFTLCHDETERHRFIENLLYAASSAGQVIVLLTMRADFYHRCAAYRDLASRISTQQVLVGPMNEVELRRAIARPARVVGLRFESGLCETILADVAQQPGALPLLQYALLELWERRQRGLLTLAAYRASGGVAGAIAQRAETLYASFSPDEQAIVRRIMLRLTQPGEGTEDTRRRVRKAELLPGGPPSVPPKGGEADKSSPPPGGIERGPSSAASQVESILHRLTDARLLTTTRDAASGEEMVDVAHEALIRGWARLREWIDEDRAALRTHRRLTEAAEEWERHQRDESYLYRGARLAETEEWAKTHTGDLNELERAFLQASLTERERVVREQAEQERRRTQIIQQRRLAVVLSIGLLILAGLAIFAFNQQSQAIIQRNSAATAQTQAEAARTEAETEAFARATAQIEAEIDRDVAIQAQETAVAAESEAQAQRNLAEVARREADGLKLAFASLNQLDTNHELASLLAVEAGMLAETFEVDTALRQSLVHPGRTLVMLTGHESFVVYAAWNDPGTQIVTASSDGTARVWDAESGAEVAVLTGHEAGLWHAAWNNWGTRIVTASSDGTARVWDAERGTEMAVLRGHESDVLHAAWNDPGTRIVTASRDGTARVWDAESGAEVAVLTGHENAVLHAAWNDSGTRIVTASNDGTARVWDAESGAEVAVLRHETGTIRLLEAGSGAEVLVTSDESKVFHAAWNDTGTQIVTTGDDMTARVWDAENGTEVAVLTGHEDWVLHAAWNDTGTQIVTASSDGTARVWDAETGAEVAILTGHEDWVLHAAWNDTGTQIVTASRDGTARVWDAERGTEVAVLTGHEAGVLHAAWNNSGTRIVTASEDGTARVWDAERGAEVAVLTGHEEWVLHAAWNDTGTRIVTASNDGTARVWDAESGAEVAVLAKDETRIWHAAWNNAGTRIVTTSDDGARIWNVESGTEVAVLTGHEDWVVYAAWNDTGTQIVTASRDGTARVWDAESGAEVAVLTGHEAGVWHAAWNNSGTRIVTASEDGTARVWDAESGAEVAVLMGHETGVLQAAWNDPGTRIVTASRDGTARVWDAESGAEVAVLTGHEAGVWHAAWNNSGTRIVTVSNDGTARVWDAESGAEVAVLEHEADVLHAAWNNSGTRIVTGSNDGTARVWDAESGAEVAVLTGHQGGVLHAAWNNSGTRIVTTSDDKTARVYYVPIADLMEAVCERSIRNLSLSEWQRFMGNEPYHKTCPALPLDSSFIEKGRELAYAGDVEGAITQFEKVLELEPSLDFDPEAEARKLAARGLIEKGGKLAYAGDIEGAIAQFKKVLELEPSLDFDPETEARKLAARGLVEKGLALARTGAIEEAVAAYEEAQTLAPGLEIPARFWNNLCWFGSLWGNADKVLEACEKAVELAPDEGGYRDSRGVARALMGNFESAIEDFEFFIEWARKRDNLEEYITKRTAWIDELKAGQNPFDTATLEELRNE